MTRPTMTHAQRRATRPNRFGRYVAMRPDGTDAYAVYDRNAVRTVVTGLGEAEAEALVRDWNRSAKCACQVCEPVMGSPMQYVADVLVRERARTP